MVDISYNQLFYCQLKIKDITIIPENILYVTIKEWAIDVVPRIEIAFQDDGMMDEIFFLEDNDPIEIMIAKDKETKEVFHGYFILQDWKINPLSNNQLTVISLSGILNSTQLHFPLFTKTFKNLNSKDTLSQIAKQCGLTFISPANLNSSDKMNWLQMNQVNYDFIKHVLDRSYKQDDAILCYCNSKKEMHFTSLNTEQDKQESKTCRYDLINAEISNFKNDIDKNTIWYNYYDLANYNGFFNKTVGYGVKYSYYDLTKYVSESIVSNNHKLSNYSFKDKTGVGQVIKSNQKGYVTNQHENYYKAYFQNKYLKETFFGFSMTLNINPQSDVSLMDKLMVSVPSLQPYQLQNTINPALSGQYLVGGIIHNISKNGIYKKKIYINRNGFNDTGHQKQYRVA